MIFNYFCNRLALLCMNRLFVSLIALTVLMISSCEEETSPTTSPSTTTSSETSPEPVADKSEEALQKLQAYYASLERENINVEQYFAKDVTSFFGNPRSRNEISQSLENGFKQVENRTLRIDPATFELTETPNGGYVAEFSGRVSLIRTEDQSEVHDMFHNRVTLDSDLMITAYESLPQEGADSPESMRTDREETPESFAETVLAIIQSGSIKELEQFCPETNKPLVMVRSGAYTFPSAFSTISELIAHASWLEDAYSGLHTRVTKGELPGFDCDELFSKQGTFVGEISQPYEEVSSLMRELEQADLDTYDEAVYARVEGTERYVTHRLIDTETGLSFCFGKIEGEWKLLVMDFATYDCSA